MRRDISTMPWSEPPTRRSYECNGRLLKAHRERLRWTQEELAGRCDLSVRVIAKGESGGSLKPDTLDVVARTLSTEDVQVHPEDLATRPEEIVREFLDNLKKYRSEVVPNSRHLLSEDVVYIMPGDPESLPFAGTHRGIDAADRAIRTFFDMVEIADPDAWTTTILICHNNEVIASQLVPAQLKGLAEKSVAPPPPTLVVYRILVTRGKISLFDDHYPSELAKENVRLQRIVRDHT